MNKSIIIPVILLAALLVTYLLVSHSEKAELAPGVDYNFLAIDSGVVNKIEIAKLGSKLQFEKHGNNWHIRQGEKVYPVEEGSVAPMEELAWHMQVGEAVSSNPDKQMLFQVDTLMGTRLSFGRDDVPLAEVIVGKMGSDGARTYVRKPESNDVYGAVRVYPQMFSRPASSFRNRTILNLDESQIRVIEIGGKEHDYTLTLQDTTWKVMLHDGDSFVADQQKVKEVISKFARLRIGKFVENPDSLLSSPGAIEIRMIVALADGSERRINLTPIGDESQDYYITTSFTDEPYILLEYMVEALAPKADDLKTGEN